MVGASKMQIKFQVSRPHAMSRCIDLLTQITSAHCMDKGEIKGLEIKNKIFIISNIERGLPITYNRCYANYE